MKIYLLNQDRSVSNTFVLQEPQTRLGREDDNDIQLLVAGVSRYHCIFEYDGFEWRVRDLGSTNGTKVNDQLVRTSTVLRPGDIIEIGDQIVRFGELSAALTATVAAKLSIFDNEEKEAEDEVEDDSKLKVIIPAENEIEKRTKTVIETPIPVISPMPAMLVKDEEPVPQVIIPGDSAAALNKDMLATAITNTLSEPSLGQYTTTATVRTPIPASDSPGSTTIGQTTAESAPMIIINLPGQEKNSGGIVFEPLAETPAAKVEPPAEQFKIQRPPPVLTPAQETMIGKPTDHHAANAEQEGGAVVTPPPETTAHTAAKGISGSTAEADKTMDVNLFDKIPLFDASPNNKQNKEPQEEDKPKRKVSNLLFYTTVICAALVLASVYIMMQKKDPGQRSAAKAVQEPEYPLLLVYEKRIIGKDNIFMFTMTLENNGVTLTLDDLKSQRRYIKEDANVKQALIDDLLSNIKSTDFMELSKQTPGTAHDGTDEYRRLTIGYNNKLQTVVVDNNFAPNSFEKIEQAINEFADGYGLQTIALTPAELKKEAEVAFNKAEELFMNRDSDPQNLSKAIKRYQLTVEYLDQFAPKPKQWDQARKRINEAKDILNKRLQDLKFDYQRQAKLQEYEEMLKTLNRILPLLDPASKEYEKYKGFQTKLDAKLKKDAKK